MSSDEAKEDEALLSSSNPNDLVIRDGFPALKRLDGKGPLISGEEPLPRQPFSSHINALDVFSVDSILQDCERVFTARTRGDEEAYSAGCTYFVPCQMKPRCALEGLALQIFQAHVKGLEGMYNPEQSGAEWWTLVLDANKSQVPNDSDSDGEDDDEVGMHFDADYGLEAQMPNVLLHPRVATVTYLSNVGAPTIVLDQHSPPPSDPERKSLNGDVKRAWLSGPKFGKHIAFDGRLLHGAPALYFPGKGSPKKTGDDGIEPDSKRQKVDDAVPEKRVTFLVNIWLNHCPLDAELLEEDVCEQMCTPWEVPPEMSKGGNQKGDDTYRPPFVWKNPDLTKCEVTEKLPLQASQDDPAGSDEVVICERIVTINFGPRMDELHEASGKIAEGASVELEFGKGGVNLEVGDAVEESNGDDGNGNAE